MSAARVPFLARLAPGAREATPSVRAALPSRFAPAEELLAPVEAPPAMPLAPDVAAHPVSPRMTPALHPAEHAAPHFAERVEPRSEPTLAPPRKARSQEPPELPAPWAPVRPALSDEGVPHAAPLDEPVAPRITAAVRSEHTRPVTPPPASPPAAPQPHAPAELRQPLREATVAQRQEARRTEDSPTVVHVSIDRLDLRLPAPPPPERRPAAARPRAATMPLADYLRQRNKGS